MLEKIKAKYYTYIPGEFMPVRVDGKLANKRAFHAYKLRRAVWLVRNYRLFYHHLIHQSG